MPLLSIAFRTVTSFRAAATIATLGGFPASCNRSLKALNAGSCRVAINAARKSVRRASARPAPNHPSPSHSTAVAGMRRQTRQRCGGAAVERSKLWQVGENAVCEDGTNARCAVAQQALCPRQVWVARDQAGDLGGDGFGLLRKTPPGGGARLRRRKASAVVAQSLTLRFLHIFQLSSRRARSARRTRIGSAAASGRRSRPPPISARTAAST